MNTKGYLPTASGLDDYVGGNGFRQDSTISTTLPFCCVSGCIRRVLVDRGDVRVTPSRINDAFERIETAAKRIHNAGVRLDQFERGHYCVP
jgi:hypothetical protein